MSSKYRPLLGYIHSLREYEQRYFLHDVNEKTSKWRLTKFINTDFEMSNV